MTTAATSTGSAQPNVDVAHGSRWHEGGASLLLEAGVNPKAVSERLGHHSVAFTLDTYAHVLPGLQSQAAEDLSDFVFGNEADAEEDEGSGDAS